MIRVAFHVPQFVLKYYLRQLGVDFSDVDNAIDELNRMGKIKTLVRLFKSVDTGLIFDTRTRIKVRFTTLSILVSVKNQYNKKIIGKHIIFRTEGNFSKIMKNVHQYKEIIGKLAVEKWFITHSFKYLTELPIDLSIFIRFRFRNSGIKKDILKVVNETYRVVYHQVYVPKIVSIVIDQISGNLIPKSLIYDYLISKAVAERDEIVRQNIGDSIVDDCKYFCNEIEKVIEAVNEEIEKIVS